MAWVGGFYKRPLKMDDIKVFRHMLEDSLGQYIFLCSAVCLQPISILISNICICNKKFYFLSPPSHSWVKPLVANFRSWTIFLSFAFKVVEPSNINGGQSREFFNIIDISPYGVIFTIFCQKPPKNDQNLVFCSMTCLCGFWGS